MDLFPSPHPLTPPQSEEDRVHWLRLLRSHRVGISTFFNLIETHGSARAALMALPEIAREAGVSRYQAAPLAMVEEEMNRARRHGAHMLCYGDADYPALLAMIPDPPPVLWTTGDRSILERSSVGVVGSRNASSLGLRAARRFARELGKGRHGTPSQVVVSGLARGIDASAHEASLETGTIGVLPGGVDVYYPSQNADLAAAIRDKGLLVSEAPMGMPPQSHHFLRRNRIISGLSRALLVVEANIRSGSTKNAETALEQGREVFAVPGHPFDQASAGTNMLIRDGATLARYAGDIFDFLDSSAAPRAPRPRAPIAAQDAGTAPTEESVLQAVQTAEMGGALHQMILDHLTEAPLAEEDLLRSLDASERAITAGIVSLELDGRITRDPSGRLTRLH